MKFEYHSWSKQIYKHIYGLTTLFLIFLLIVVSYLSWFQNQSESAYAKANSYHLSSSNYYQDALIELQLAKNSILEGHIKAIYMPEQAGIPASTFRTHSLFIIKDKIKSSLKLQETFKESQFDSLIAKLDEKLKAYDIEVQKYLNNSKNSLNLTKAFTGVSIPLHQLIYLHNIERKLVLSKWQEDQ